MKQTPDANDRPALDDLRVTPFKEWCRSKGISYSTGRRLRDRGEGPDITQLSARLTGVTVQADREWTARRKRADRSGTTSERATTS